MAIETISDTDWTASGIVFRSPEILSMSVILFFIVMIIGLIGVHAFLIMHNLTTCTFSTFSSFTLFIGEKLSWQKITYLKEWPEQAGSPFDRGCWTNIRLLCCFDYATAKVDYIKWKIPRLPT